MTETPVAARARSRSRYFLGLAALLLVVVVLGFWRTFFARAFFEVPTIPWYLYAHGTLLTAWFGLLVAQAALVAADRADLHRRLGVLGACIAAGVVAISLFAALSLPARAAAGVSSTGSLMDPTTARMILWTDLAALTIFSLYVAIALRLRRRSDVHKRLMVLASIAILGPASARVGLLLDQHTALPPSVQATVQLLLFFGLPLTLVAHDLIAMRRVHRTTIVGVVGLLASTFLAIAIALSPVGAALVSALE